MRKSYIRTPEIREKNRLSNLGKHNFKHTPEAIAKIAMASAHQETEGKTNVEYYGPERAAEIRKKKSEAMTGIQTAKRGKCYTYMSIQCTKQHDPAIWCKYCIFEQDLHFRQRIVSMIGSAKNRAEKAKLPFNLTSDDVLKVWPEDNCCPILSIPFDLTTKKNGKGGGKHNSPSLDKVIPTQGYVVGNIAIISCLANLIKQDCTEAETFEKMANWLRKWKQEHQVLNGIPFDSHESWDKLIA